ncbi:DUF4034 domain-containing protein [Luteimonas sp. SMYT11W]|uniref:DUF4034 domain-containing protein n=1 Tax=Luteimonas flava TaxID=3115822 RepID=A0ABU7WDU7_9GAMM
MELKRMNERLAFTCSPSGSRPAFERVAQIALASAVLMVGTHGPASAGPQALPAIPDTPRDAQFVGVPGAWRDYLIGVRAARQIEAPLARCLAWPDLPDNQWPEGHAAAHCRYHFSEGPSPTQAAALLEAGDVQTLERLMAEMAAGHGQREDAERVHTFFHDLADMPAAARDRLTSRWVDAAPRSAYAAMARGRHFAKQGWEARGTALAPQTSEAQFAGMRAGFIEAIPFYRRAVELDPDLTHAYIGMMEIAKAVSDAELEAWAFARAQLAGPACAEVAVSRMGALQPRWGGSLKEMERYAEMLSPRVTAFPLLANSLVEPYNELTLMEIAANRYTQPAADIADVATRIASNEDALARAAQLSMHRSDGSPVDDVKGLALLLQRERFEHLTPWQAREVASRLLRVEPEWTYATITDAVARDPDSAYGHYLLGAASYNVGRFEQADRHYQLARLDVRQEQTVLRELVTMWMFDAGLPADAAMAKAGPYLDTLLAKFPRDGRAHLWEWSRREYFGEPPPRQWFLGFLAVADPKDPVQVQAIETIKRKLAE